MTASSSRSAPPASPHQREIAQALTAADAGTRREGPLVSIVVHVLHDSSHLESLMLRLEQTFYWPLELIVVFDETHTTIDRAIVSSLSFPVTFRGNDGEVAPAVGRNLGAAQGNGLLLFFPDDLEPANPGWLGHMVTTLEKPGTVAVGTLIVGATGNGQELAIAHAGADMRGRGSAPLLKSRFGPNVTTAELPPEWPVDVIDGAPILVRKGDFDEIGGFDTNFLYGFEDIDLCLRLSGRGRLLVTGNAVCIEGAGSSSAPMDNDLVRVATTGNLQSFSEKWGARITRTAFRRHLMRSAASRSVAITLPPEDLDIRETDYHTSQRLAAVFESEGWVVHLVPTADESSGDIPGEVDLFISLVDYFDAGLVPNGAIKVAWIRKWLDKWTEKEWFADFDVAFAASQRAVDTVREISPVPARLLPPAIDISMFTPGAEAPLFRTDYVVVANNRGRGRILADVWDVRPGERALVFGRGWESVPRFTRYWRGHLRYEHLPDAFRSTKIALDDTSRALKAYGFINDSALEALASGALVITDNEEASEQLFDGHLPVYRNSQEFRTLLDHFTTDDAARSELVNSLRQRVLNSHDVKTVPRRLLNELEQVLYQPTLALKIAVPSDEAAPQWGDTHFANGMAAALRAFGFRTTVDLLPDWDLPRHQEVDVVVHIRGRKTYVPKPAHINIMWLISHPDDLTPDECDAYDLILVASRRFAERLAALTSTPVHFMPQATDARRFESGPPDNEATSDVLFVGNTRGGNRSVVEWALEQGLPLTVYGRGWQGLPNEVFAGEFVPNEDLSSLYRSAGVVLNDHWPDMRREGFVSNRIFDVLGSGGVIVSDPVNGLEDLFGGLVPTYESPGELGDIVTNLLKDPSRRREIANKGAAIVKQKHTFDRRARQLVELLRPRLEHHDLDLDGTRPGP